MSDSSSNITFLPDQPTDKQSIFSKIFGFLKSSGIAFWGILLVVGGVLLKIFLNYRGETKQDQRDQDNAATGHDQHVQDQNNKLDDASKIDDKRVSDVKNNDKDIQNKQTDIQNQVNQDVQDINDIQASPEDRTVDKSDERIDDLLYGFKDNT